MSGVSVEKLQSTVMEALTSWNEEIDEIAKQEVDNVAKEAKQAVQSYGNYNDRNGSGKNRSYRKRFAIKTIAEGDGYKRVKVCNTKYQIGHLLEFGHATRKGGRTKAFPHWKYGQEIIGTLPERIGKLVESKK